MAEFQTERFFMAKPNLAAIRWRVVSEILEGRRQISIPDTPVFWSNLPVTLEALA